MDSRVCPNFGVAGPRATSAPAGNLSGPTVSSSPKARPLRTSTRRTACSSAGPSPKGRRRGRGASRHLRQLGAKGQILTTTSGARGSPSSWQRRACPAREQHELDLAALREDGRRRDGGRAGGLAGDPQPAPEGTASAPHGTAATSEDTWHALDDTLPAPAGPRICQTGRRPRQRRGRPHRMTRDPRWATGRPRGRCPPWVTAPTREAGYGSEARGRSPQHRILGFVPGRRETAGDPTGVTAPRQAAPSDTAASPSPADTRRTPGRDSDRTRRGVIHAGCARGEGGRTG